MKKEPKTTDTEETHGNVNGTGKPHYGKTDEQLLKKDPTNTETVEKIEIENTPFTAVRIDDKWYIVMGKYRLTNEIATKEEALAAAIDESWWRIMSVIKAMIIEHEEQKGKLKENILEGIISKVKTIE